ncbi:MAG: tRNA lysidine(34) synthetase TilS, partial [Eudoraea sp.]|nr:tRNA lysidine(34) synthetase TilS [Eudoraea sp.]
MLAKFKKHIEDKFPELLESSMLLACSGGVDSVVLVHLCESIKLNYAIAHCNFRLRGEESDKDEKLVEELANKFGVEYHVTHFDTIGYVNKNKVSVQMAARELRYAWFAELMAEKHYDYVVTAHHADDTLETFIINLSRGTGIEGLMGIPASSSTVMRPLLIFSRKDILDYAREKNIIWREDPSNEDLKYLRNKIRHQIVPVLKELHPTFDKNFAKTLEHLAGTSSLVDQHIQDLKNEFFQVQEGHIRISVASLRALRPLKPYIYAIFRDYGFTAWDDVLGLLTSGSGKELRSATHRLIKDREVLLLEPLASKRSFEEEYFIDDANARLPIKLELETVDKME